MSNPENKSLSIPFLLFCLLIVSVPFTITTYLNNQSDLPKNAALQITVSMFVFSVIWIYFKKMIKRGSEDDQGILIFNKQLDPFVLSFLLAAILSTVFSLNSYISFAGQYERQYGLSLIIFVTLFYFFSSVVYKEEKNIPRILLITEIVSAVVASYAILLWFGIDLLELQPLNDKRPVSLLGNAVFTGGFLAMNLPVSMLNVSGKKNLVIRIIFPLIIALGIIITGTRSAYMAVIAMLMVLAVFYPVAAGTRGKSFRKKIILSLLILSGGIVLTILIIFLFNSNPFVQRALSIFSSGDNPRLVLWHDSINVFLKYPMFGPGLGMFPNALEEFYSIRLRNDEIRRYFDNAHSNYIQTLCTMGITGLIVYMLVLFAGIKACIKSIFSQSDKNEKRVFLSLLCVIAAYSVYGLTNFDEIAITLYLFIYLSIIRFLYKNDSARKLRISDTKPVPAILVSVLIILFCSYSMYNIIDNVRADRNYLEGVMYFSNQKFTEGVNKMNSAITLNGECGYYRYNLASNVYSFASSNNKLSIESRNNLLKQAAEEMLRARKTFISINSCDAMLAMMYYEIGETARADSIKDEVLMRDPVSMSLRLNLIVYYSKVDKTDKARENLEYVLKTGFESVGVWNAAAFYYYKTGNKEKASLYYNKILSREPGNKAVIEMLDKLK